MVICHGIVLWSQQSEIESSKVFILMLRKHFSEQEGTTIAL